MAAVLPETADNSQRLAMLRRWAGEDRTLAKTLSEAMSDRAGGLWKAGKQPTGDALLDAAEAICPDRHEACARQRLDWLKSRLADKDYTGVVRGLQAVNLDNVPPALRAELADICLQAAHGLAKTDVPAAQARPGQGFSTGARGGQDRGERPAVDRAASRADRREAAAVQGVRDRGPQRSARQ